MSGGVGAVVVAMEVAKGILFTLLVVSSRFWEVLVVAVVTQVAGMAETENPRTWRD